jgi:hypothetical protein
LNVADYFFVSTHVAKAYPDLMESMIVLAYKSFMPGAIGHKWKHHTDIERESTGKGSLDRRNVFVHRIIEFFAFSLSVFETFVVASVPLSVQKMMVRFLEPILWGGLSYIWMLISHSMISVTVFVSTVAGIVVVILYRYYKDKRKSEKTITEDHLLIQELTMFENVSNNLSNDHAPHCNSKNESSMSSGAFELWFDNSIVDSSSLALSLSADNEDSSSASTESFEPSSSSIVDDQLQVSELDYQSKSSIHSAISSENCSFEYLN